ncbi:ATP-binding protein [Microbacter margulisiae]|uniref:AAA+ ATPase domain-containing protein n=1 Tax=Microbacter margulisiae TaxID=1350067 RepID=A0A7W5DS15_9PORP|nr:ATP-binding protein [Microbacter margulisiae]MBB3187183.1 hypothetical protein [Microbacter margulisiae]
MYIPREIENNILTSLNNNPVVALIGPRQCGKSTLVRHILTSQPNSIYLDMERPSDLQKLNDAEWFLSTQKGKLICIDEVQRQPMLFPLIRSLVDEWGTNGSFLLLGSASRDLLQQSAESLAGRISYKRLTPFLWKELHGTVNFETYFSMGAFPRSILAINPDASFEWRENFISTFLERDLLFWRGVTPSAMRRLWQMLAHVNGQTVDYSTLAKSLGVSSVTVKNYIDLLESTFMVEVVPAYISNTGKRLVKASKVYVADTGITAALLNLRSFEEIAGHPSLGAIWEQIVLSNLKGLFPDAIFNFYRTSNGAEIDFVVTVKGIVLAIECKSSYAPVLSRGNYHAIADIAPRHVFIVSPIEKGWQMKPEMDVVSLNELEYKIREITE